MKQITVLISLVIGLSMSAFCGVVIPGVASYDPPLFFVGTEPRRDPGDNPFSGQAPSIEYLAKDNGYTHFRQFNVGTRAVGFTIGEGKRVEYTKVTDDTLKKLMLDTFTERATNSPKVEEIVFAGHKAFRVHCVVPMPQIRDEVIFLFEYIWVPIKPNLVIELKLVGSDENLLKTVRDSLSTFKILPPSSAKPEPAELPIAKNAAQLGDIRADVAKAAGKSVSSDPSSDIYYTGKYFVIVSYRMPNVTHITYFRASDPNRLAEAFRSHKPDIMNNVLPLQKDEIQDLFSLHSTSSTGVALKWKSSGDNRWERSDGVKAGYDARNKALTIATKEIWPNLMIFQK